MRKILSAIEVSSSLFYEAIICVYFFPGHCWPPECLNLRVFWKIRPQSNCSQYLVVSPSSYWIEYWNCDERLPEILIALHPAITLSQFTNLYLFNCSSSASLKVYLKQFFTYGRNKSTSFELVKDSFEARGIKTYHQNPHLFLSKEFSTTRDITVPVAATDATANQWS